SLLHSETPFKFVNLLLEIADRDGDQYYHKMYGHILRDAGRETTLGFLDAITAEQFILGVEAYYEIHESVYKRVHKIKRDYTPPYIPPPPDEHDLETARMSFEINDSYMFDQSFGLLSKYDPAFVIDFLLTWENQDRRLPYKGYKLGSTFAMLCENNRENYFRELLTAKDPYLQVTGAVYLTLDGHQDGIIELQRLTSLEGDAGAWAALNLARRGDKIAVDRILEVFNNEGYDNINLHQRVMILLSNSAAASGLSTDQQPWKYKPVDPEQDRYPDECGDNRHCQKYLEWWELYKNDITLYDPWFEIFEAQKVD
ncbi:MAG: hypothetical protein H8D46_03915, partial [FCB group bacterium]|nr:hypothetical protein [FCB group bacterium]